MYGNELLSKLMAQEMTAKLLSFPHTFNELSLLGFERT